MYRRLGSFVKIILCISICIYIFPPYISRYMYLYSNLHGRIWGPVGALAAPAGMRKQRKYRYCIASEPLGARKCCAGLLRSCLALENVAQVLLWSRLALENVAQASLRSRLTVRVPAAGALSSALCAPWQLLCRHICRSNSLRQSTFESGPHQEIRANDSLSLRADTKSRLAFSALSTSGGRWDMI